MLILVLFCVAELILLKIISANVDLANYIYCINKQEPTQWFIIFIINYYCKQTKTKHLALRLGAFLFPSFN